ncbi:MAG: STM3941 family protein [Hyphomicrobiaceae bacterium]|nr:STM3941 family protein [Hyphomicrobiaceae bacterium]
MATENIDTSARVEIGQSPLKMLGLLAGAIALTAASAFIIIGPAGEDPASFIAFIGWIGVVFFGLCGAIILWRSLTARGPTVTISPEGLHDVRVSRLPIPWSAIRRLSTWSYQSQRILVVEVDQATEDAIGLTRVARWTRGPNKALGADGLSIATQGLRIGYDRLLDLVSAYADAHRHRSPRPSATRHA